MVKFRGIDISIVSQFDIRKLPEFSIPTSVLQTRRSTSTASVDHDPFTSCPPHPSLPQLQLKHANDSKSTAACFIPTYPGSQIWLEYSITPPHPPGAAYFFKLVHNGSVITSWDCMAKHGYMGKMSYALEVAEGGYLRRRALRFGSGAGDTNKDKEQGLGQDDNCLEVRVHRVEGRKRVDLEEDACSPARDTKLDDSLRLVNGGFVEPGHPRRRYRYQLLDPVDEPYARFRFYYRSYDFLEDHNIITPNPDQSPSSSISSANWYESSSVAREVVEPAVTTSSETSALQEKGCGTRQLEGESTSLDSQQAGSEESLQLKTKDSVEDMCSNVPRSPRSPNSTTGRSPGKEPSAVPRSPTRSLTVNLDGTEFNLEKKRRPLSPFTTAGLLRRVRNGDSSPIVLPPSAPATVTEFGPSISDEIEENDSEIVAGLSDKGRRTGCERTTREARGGRNLIGFLGRRIGNVSVD